MPVPTVVITRDASGNHELAKKLESAGFEVMDWPTFEFEPLALSEKDFQILEKKHDWIVFTSAEAVRQYFAVARNVLQLKSFPKIAVLGGQTRKAVMSFGGKVDLVAAKASAHGLAIEPTFSATHGLRILWPRARDASDELQQILSEKHQVDSVIFYQKHPLKKSAKDIQKLLSSHSDWTLFYSPSAIQCFLEGFDEPGRALNTLKKTKLAVIGESTASKLRSLGLEPLVISQQTSTEDLISLMGSPIKSR